MSCIIILSLLALFNFQWTSATILQNGQVRENPYPGQAPHLAIHETWRTYAADAPEIAYKGRWDSQHTSWWAAPGIKLGFTGNQLAINFGPNTSEGVLVAYRLGGLDWLYSNVTAGCTYQFIGPWTPGINESAVTDQKTFELRVQISSVSVGADSHLKTIPPFRKKVEIIGDSLASGMFTTYETLSGWGYNFAAGLGDVEYTITAYPGICLLDKQCYHPKSRGMLYQWDYVSDKSPRAKTQYGTNPKKWDFSSKQPADLVLIDLGTNDHKNYIDGEPLRAGYLEMVNKVHRVWPYAQIVIMSLWGRFEKQGTTYVQKPYYEAEIKAVYEEFKNKGFVHYFDTTGILQHSDVSPGHHPTGVGHLKVASHLLRWVKMELGWELHATGPEVQHDTQYWNNQKEY